MTYFFSQRTQRNRTHRVQKDDGPSPVPSPEGKGRDHRDTPMGRMEAACCPLSVSTIAETFCDICMPEAFCEFETVRKKVLLNLCVL